MIVPSPDGRLLEYSADPDSEWRRQTFDPSLADPMSVVVPYLSEPPEWVVIGGLGDCDDVGPTLRRWPWVKVLGIDPDIRAIEWQRAHSWPARGPLIQAALSDECGRAVMNPSTICCASLHPTNVSVAAPEELLWVETVTLDELDFKYGPFSCACIWLDCEGYDYKAIQGASNLLRSGRVMVVNIEVAYYDMDAAAIMWKSLAEYGYKHVLTWFRQWWGHNEVWVRNA